MTPKILRKVTEIDDEEKEKLLKFIWQQKHEQTLSIRQIAQNVTLEFGIDVNRGYVERHLHDLHEDAMIVLKRWAVFRIQEYVEHYDKIFAESIAAWEQSKQPLERRKTRQLKDGTEKEDVTIEERLPDPSYLRTAMEAMTQVRRMLGMDSATQFEYIHHEGRGGAGSGASVGSGDDENETLKQMISDVLGREALPEEVEGDE